MDLPMIRICKGNKGIILHVHVMCSIFNVHVHVHVYEEHIF